MDSTKERYFFLSGLISLSLFALLVLLVGYSLLISSKIEQFAMTQSDTVSISVVLSDAASEAQTNSAEVLPAAEPEPIPEPVEEVRPAKPEPAPEISDLFSQVKPQIEPKKKTDDAKRVQELSNLEKEIMQRDERERFSDKVKNIELLKPGMKMVVQGGSTGPVVNEYHAKIQGLIYMQFHPPAGSQGQAARVRIKISPEGRLISYKIIAYSGSKVLNSEVDWLGERLASLKFPSHPENKEASLECILTAKE